jgi:5-formyltetrahydrofolate cyclo-ligase
MDKQALRGKLKRERLELSSQEVAERSQKITKRLLKILDLSSIHSMHTYLPIEKQNEVDTRPILELVWDKYPHIKTATWSNPGKNAKPVWLNRSGQQLYVSPDFQFDLIIVPLLGFDSRNHRIGSGGGFYDRFLSTQHKALKIGLCFQSGFVKEGIGFEPHDIVLDKIVTEI